MRANVWFPGPDNDATLIVPATHVGTGCLAAEGRHCTCHASGIPYVRGGLTAHSETPPQALPSPARDGRQEIYLFGGTVARTPRHHRSWLHPGRRHVVVVKGVPGTVNAASKASAGSEASLREKVQGCRW